MTMVTNAGDVAFYTKFNHCFVVVDKITQAMEPDMWNIFSHYLFVTLFMVEDEV